MHPAAAHARKQAQMKQIADIARLAQVRFAAQPETVAKLQGVIDEAEAACLTTSDLSALWERTRNVRRGLYGTPNELEQAAATFATCGSLVAARAEAHRLDTHECGYWHKVAQILDGAVEVRS